MSNQKIIFGKYNLIIEPLKKFYNAVFSARNNPTPEFDDLCNFLDKELSQKHKRQINGTGKRYWGELNDRTIKRLEVIADKYNESLNITPLVSATIIPEEITSPEKYQEGSTKIISVNVYERNPKARSKCIEHYGNNCTICDFNFGEVFGELGEGFIHVHHLKPLSEIKESYNLDPITDLRPVCPNCHSMLHRKSPALSIEDLVNLKKANK